MDPPPPTSSSHKRRRSVAVDQSPPAKLHKTASSSSQLPPASQSIWDEADDEAHAAEVIDLSQAGPDQGDSLESVGVLDTKVVGCRFYNGIATMGEKLLVRREPANQYDRNAIRIDNVNHIQIGHINRQMAAKLAPLIDNGTITVEATVSGPKGYYDMPVSLEFLGDARNAGAFKDALKTHGIKTKRSEEQRRMEQQAREEAKREKARAKAKKVKIGKGGAPPTGNGDVELEVDEYGEFVGSQGQHADLTKTWEELAGQSELLDPREIGGVVSKLGIGEENLEKMPEAKQPSALQTQLLPYQRQGLAWLLQMEHPQLPKDEKDVVQLWKKVGSNRFQNIATNFTTDQQPVFSSGGILADDMGLGKTIQIISLIASDVKKQQELVPVPYVDEKDCDAGTLIIAPLSVMSNWTQQIDQHVSKSSPLTHFTYHGPARLTADLGYFDVVVTSYGTMSAEFNPKSKAIPKKGLFSRKWRRVVLDEAHTIRNPKAKSSLAATALRSLSYWSLSGTPIVNHLKDLYSLLRFMRFPGGLADLEIFNRLLVRPLNRGDPTASQLLQVLVATLCMRRTKDMKFVDLKLPAFSSRIRKVDLIADERKKYDILEAEAKGLLTTYQKGKSTDVAQAYRNLLEILLRMRQCVNHPNLCQARLKGLMELAGIEVVDLQMNPEQKTALQDLLSLALDAQEDCPICLEPLNTHPSGSRITVCKHVFGLDCISRVIELQQKCPMCRSPLLEPAPTVLVEPATDIEPAAESTDATTPSSKITALLELLTATPTDRKTVIFSQWTSFLSLLSPFLTAAGISFTRIDGSMKPSQRDDAIRAFRDDPHCAVLLASLTVCSVGINLTMASQVVLMDSWWAGAIEQQAVDRVYRLGQKADVDCWRIVVGGSIEERVLRVQEKKRVLVETAFMEERRKGRKGRGVADIVELLG